ncbi:MAG: hypothetical protein HY909_07405 [Deltaproteobacteria bacterium]|nr:hypothetical protein [Deltaproteobacteria bacterium]
MTASVAQRLARAEAPALPEGTGPLWDGRRPRTLEGWVALGREVFFGYPLRVEVFLEWALAHPGALDEAGLERAPDGGYVGVRVFQDLDGAARVGITCALCHTRTRGPTLVEGEARRTFDYGRLRLAYHRETGAPVDPELARRMATWGPGRADVTEDDAEDPVAIPDLWGLRHQSHLTQAGTIRHTGPSALAIRQETQLLHANHQRVRPPRELSWALAMYLYGLAPPAAPPSTATEDELARGRAVFLRDCVGCHDNPVYGGLPVAVGRVGTHPALANGGARGTGRYRPPALLGLLQAGPYLHDGSVATLEELFSAERLLAGYRLGALGPGPVPGHRWGTALPDDERRALLAWLRTR